MRSAWRKSGRIRRIVRGYDSGGRMTGIVYTETLIHSAPEAFVSEAPYQLIIVTLDGRRPGHGPGRG